MAYTFKDLAEEILGSAQEPMTPAEIWHEAERRGLVSKLGSHGKTPQDSLAAQLYTDVKAAHSRFAIHEGKPKRFSLADVSPKADASARQAVAASPRRTFTECAQLVLETFANRQPMHYLDITRKALEQGWLHTDGKTPEASLYAQILTQISRAQEKGAEPLFVKYGRGMVGLSAWNKSGIDGLADRHNTDVRKKLLARLLKMPPSAFERLIQRLLIEMGFVETSVTPISKDGGIDVRGTWEIAGGIRQRYAVQVKRWKGNIQAPTVQNVRGSLKTGELGLIITTSDFTKGARTEARDETKHSPISLVNGKQLVELLIANGIGVRVERIEVLELDDSL